MSTRHQLGDLQLAIMRVLWSRTEATVNEVHRELEDARGLALTTIATMLKKMELKGVVNHRTEGRQFVYRPTIDAAAVNRTMVSELTDRLFGGSAAALVNHLLTEGEIDASELTELRQRIEDEGKRA
ncbi:MAG: BlaI/MecI/CopY family transcriptional regulator [Planctomycetota bacterium]|nr:BlaI/MecI/CopY family transcriptional regulator [Planctomycetota bacterium]